MVNNRESPTQAAPGRLEQVRELLNTWLIPNETREPTDRFDEYVRQHSVPAADRAGLRRLRDDLRRSVETEPPRSYEMINAWVEELGLRPRVVEDAIRFEPAGAPVNEMVTVVLEAIAAGQLDRLKACPDCRWVFYDHTRNRSKRWCLMNAGGPEGRGCGTIAKVKRYRERHAV